MGYQLEFNESIADGLKRILNEQLEKAIANLKGETEDKSDAVHTARKCLKKVRAIVRLLRDELGEEVYQLENACFRNAGKQLSDVRDSQVLIETLDKLVSYYSDTITIDAFAGVRGILVAQYEVLSQQMLGENSAVEEVIDILEEARSRVNNWELKHENWGAIEFGLKRIYKQGRNRLAKAYEQPTNENFHDWRKRVKDHWYHLRILKPIWLEVMTPLANEASLLSDYLGDDHDLAVLEDYLIQQPDKYGDREKLEVLLSLIKRRRPQLQLAAKKIGQRLYSEKPSQFCDRISTYWKVWQSEINPPLV